jgi:methionyl-tRNA formyltransferase
VAAAAAERGWPVEKPASLRTPEAQQRVREAGAEVMVVAAYGLILPAAVLDICPHGCINIHASLLPRWRGAAPIQRAILAGDVATGVTIMQMDAGLDTGPALLDKPYPIGARETTGSLTQALADLGAAAVVEALAGLGRWTPRPQDESLASYARKVTKAEARVQWTGSSLSIDRQVRAFDPAPGAEARLGDETVKIWGAEPVTGRGTPGEVLAAGAEGIVVACGQGALRITVLQRPGARRLSAAQFLQGRALAAGERLG